MAELKLIVGPRRFSTWSLRPWLVLKRAGADFETVEIDFTTPVGHVELKAVSPSGLVPLLQVDGETIWDSLAISEWAAERFPEARLWPAAPTARALARSATAEMHGGFIQLRTALTMNGGHLMVGDSRSEAPSHVAAEDDIRRLIGLWREMRERFGADGPWLFGDWSIADAFFTPVATRFRHYGVDLAALGDDGTAAAYAATLLADADFRAWEAEALRNL